jgi:hypothetical protein
MNVKLRKSTKQDKKYMVSIENKTIHFGSAGMDDFTLKKNEDQKRRYLARHSTNQDWTKSGIKTAGFWARWLLWNKPTIQESKKDISQRFKVIFI